MSIVWFDQKAPADEIGGKGLRLCQLAQAGLPVPRGFCITVNGMDCIRLCDIEAALDRLGAKSVAVRSSAPGEDGMIASFAGIYVSRLNISCSKDVADALAEIRASASSPAARAYRQKRGITGVARMAAIVQEFVTPDASGVLFMNDPVEGSPRMVVEGSWGLGEAVVAGRVTPDRWIFSEQGDLISTVISEKDVAIVPFEHGIREVQLDSSRSKLPCLDELSLRQLFELAAACEELFGGPQDIEWAAASRLWLLQSRPITTRRS